MIRLTIQRIATIIKLQKATIQEMTQEIKVLHQEVAGVEDPEGTLIKVPKAAGEHLDTQ